MNFFYKQLQEYGRNDSMKLERPKSKDRAEYLSLLHYSFNLNPSMRRQISLELSTLTSQHDLFIKTRSDVEKHEILTDVLDGRNIQTKKEVVMQGRKLHKVTRKKISSHDSHVHSDNKMPLNTKTRPLSELSVVDVGFLLDRLDISEFKAVLLRNKIDGKSLVRCSTVDEVEEMGIPITVKAKLLFEKIREFQVNGVPMEYVQISTQVYSMCTIVMIVKCLL
jgi:hypothetical protein